MQFKEKDSSSIIDYKVWCINGKAKYIMVVTNRSKSHANMLVYDHEWNVVENSILQTSHFTLGRVIPKPSNFNEILRTAEILSAKFPCVRIDLYNINNVIYFGEMTFTSLAGLMNYFTPSFLLEVGMHIDLTDVSIDCKYK